MRAICLYLSRLFAGFAGNVSVIDGNELAKWVADVSVIDDQKRITGGVTGKFAVMIGDDGMSPICQTVRLHEGRIVEICPRQWEAS